MHLLHFSNFHHISDEHTSVSVLFGKKIKIIFFFQVFI